MPEPAIRLRAGMLFAEPGAGPARRHVEIAIAGDTIAAIHDLPERELSEAERATIVLPGLADAHDHGRGVSPLAYGAADQVLELWLPGLILHPAVSAYRTAAVALGRLARAGFTSVAHFHVPQRLDRVADEAEEVARAARDIGLRLAFIVPLRDRNRLCYGPDEAVLELLEPALRAAVRAQWAGPIPSPERQIEAVEAIAQRIGGEGIDVQYGPTGPQWCSDGLLAEIARRSAATGRRVHTHLYETRHQRDWAERAHPGGFLRHLDSLGLLSDRLTVAHGVWLDEQDCAVLAARGARVAVNASSNLRLRSGRAPVERFRAAGLDFGLGLDGLALDDDSDGLRELRLAAALNDGPGVGRGVPRAAFCAALFGAGHAIVGAGGRHGAVRPGATADLVLLDRSRFAADAIPGLGEPFDALVQRADARDVSGVIAAGRWIVRDRRVLGIDLPALELALAAEARAGADSARALAPMLARYQAALADFYRGTP